MKTTNNITVNTNASHLKQLADVSQFILRCQQDDGAILWFDGGKLDPWDHTEAAMALTVTGHTRQALDAFHWLQRHQHADGSWHAYYFDEAPSSWDDHNKQDQTHNSGHTQKNKYLSRIEPNFVAYCATGIWHYGCVTQDWQTAAQFFPMVSAAINFVLEQQNVEGDIQWAVSADTLKPLPQDALVTGCSSILRSLECAIALAEQLNIAQADWIEGYHRLADALRNKPWRFDRTWESKARYSMDWFYPILAGMFNPQEAAERLQRKWRQFVEPGVGCRCVSDEPWVTIAESSELVMALVAAGEKNKAATLHQWLCQWREKDGSFWTGFNFRDAVIWPPEKTSWTAAAYILAGDALYQLTPAATLFTRPSRLLFTQ